MTTTQDFISTMTVNQLIGERVNLWMRRRGLMQMDLAPALGVNASVVSRKISGQTTWSAVDLVRTASFLEVPLSELLPEEMVEIEKMRLASAHAEQKPVSEPPVRLELTTFALRAETTVLVTVNADYDQALLLLILFAHVPALPQVPAAPALLVALVIRALHVLSSSCPLPRDSRSHHGRALEDEHSNELPDITHHR